MRAFEMPPHARMSLVQAADAAGRWSLVLEPAVLRRDDTWGKGLARPLHAPTFFMRMDLEDVMQELSERVRIRSGLGLRRTSKFASRATEKPERGASI